MSGHCFHVSDRVWYGSLGHKVEFKILARCEDGRWVLETVKSNQQYPGGWPIGRTMLAEEIMLRRLLETEWPSDESVRIAYPGGPTPSDSGFEGLRTQLRDALLIDPIIKAAVELRNAIGNPFETGESEARRLIQAIDKAGL
jgi:hypothetical protein